MMFQQTICWALKIDPTNGESLLKEHTSGDCAGDGGSVPERSEDQHN